MSVFIVNLWWPDAESQHVQSVSLIRMCLYYVHSCYSDDCSRVLVKWSRFGDNLATAAVLYLHQNTWVECACVDLQAFMSKSFLAQINILPPVPNDPSLSPTPWKSLVWKSRDVYKKWEQWLKPCLYFYTVRFSAWFCCCEIFLCHESLECIIANLALLRPKTSDNKVLATFEFFWLSMKTAAMFVKKPPIGWCKTQNTQWNVWVNDLGK